MEEHDEIIGKLNKYKLPVNNNDCKDALAYYEHVHPEWKQENTQSIFIALCKMNEFFATKNIEIIRLETICEMEVGLDQGDGGGALAATGIRVYF